MQRAIPPRTLQNLQYNESLNKLFLSRRESISLEILVLTIYIYIAQFTLESHSSSIDQYMPPFDIKFDTFVVRNNRGELL